MLHVLEHAFIDSLNVFILVFVLYFILSFIEKYINKQLNSNNKLSPLFGALIGLVPQCGISVCASDLYIKRKITIGTLISVFLACSDEAIFILLASEKFLTVIPLLLTKLIIGFSSGFIIDFIIAQKIKKTTEENVECCHHHHHKKKNKILDNLLHTLSHSFEVFVYVFVVNLLFGLLFYFIGENNIILFLERNKYLSPLLATLIGAIPNCASSIILSELYIIGGISFGTLIAGLLINAGLGMIYLFKEKANFKNNIKIFIFMVIVSMIFGYVICLINGF